MLATPVRTITTGALRRMQPRCQRIVRLTRAPAPYVLAEVVGDMSLREQVVRHPPMVWVEDLRAGGGVPRIDVV